MYFQTSNLFLHKTAGGNTGNC